MLTCRRANESQLTRISFEKVTIVLILRTTNLRCALEPAEKIGSDLRSESNPHQGRRIAIRMTQQNWMPLPNTLPAVAHPVN